MVKIPKKKWEKEGKIKIKVGQSLALLTDCRVGIIRYADKVKFAGGTWYGLELLNAPGSHNGTVKGRRYFRSKKEGQAIFVKQHAIEEILKKKPTKEELTFLGRQFTLTEEIYASGKQTQWYRKREIEKFFRMMLEVESKLKFELPDPVMALILTYSKAGIDVVGKFQLQHGLLQCSGEGTWEMTDRSTLVRGSGTWVLHRQQVQFFNGESIKPDPWLAKQFYIQFAKKKSFVFKQNTVGSVQILRSAFISMPDLDETRNLYD